VQDEHFMPYPDASRKHRGGKPLRESLGPQSAAMPQSCGMSLHRIAIMGNMQLSQIAKRMTVAEWIAFILSSASAVPDPRAPGLPDDETQKITNNLSGARSLEGAARMYSFIADVVGKRPYAEPRILDFGCGWGRITRLLPQLTSDDNIFGIDVDDRLVAACRHFLVGMHFTLVKPMEPLPFPDAHFNLVLANSVFSHLNEHSQRFYVNEIGRCTRAGGIFIATTMGLRNLNTMLSSKSGWLTTVISSSEQAENDLRAGRFVYYPTRRLKDYGIAFVPKGWTAANWAPKFEVVDVATSLSQDVNVAIRTGSS
jgi:SAM-dependent methyltransferase